MTKDEIKSNYELNTGKVIVRRFAGLDPMQMPGALGTITINPNQKAISQALLDKHYLRKHGKEAYYGQK